MLGTNGETRQLHPQFHVSENGCGNIHESECDDGCALRSVKIDSMVLQCGREESG